MSHNEQLTSIAPAQVRYIKLGQKNAWARASLDRGEIHFGYKTVPHDVCLTGDWEHLTRNFKAVDGKREGKAKDCTRELRDFYEMGADCLWITFADDHLWWAFAKPGVTWLGEERDGRGARFRTTIGTWRNTDINGNPLRIQELSSRLTQVAAYRQTICRVAASDYLIRRINGIEEPVLIQARKAREAMRTAASEMIEKLHWADFETMVDLIFARSGWRRVSRLGGTQKDVDLILDLPTTGERAAVQVKSKADQALVDRCVETMSRGGAYDRVFFVCHSARSELALADTDPSDTKAHLWTGSALADAALGAGLFDWLMERVA